jgi:TPR repeat protein
MGVSAKCTRREQKIALFVERRMQQVKMSVLLRLKKRINAGDPRALNNLGILYKNGRSHLSRDLKKAFEFYSRAAELGLAEAHSNLGNLYEMETVCNAIQRKRCITGNKQQYWDANQQGTLLAFTRKTEAISFVQ